MERELRRRKAEVLEAETVTPLRSGGETRGPVGLVPYSGPPRREPEGSVTVRLRMTDIRRLKMLAVQREIQTDMHVSPASLVREMVERAMTRV